MNDINQNLSFLVTGGLGYIGSHVCVELLKCGYKVYIIDNLSNCKEEVFAHIKDASGSEDAVLNKADLKDLAALNAIFKQNRFDAVFHFAGYKAVSESVQNPIKYYDNNIQGTVNLLRMMVEHGVKRLVFSSSATVYGTSDNLPYYEAHPLQAVNPYGRTKLYIEEILSDVYNANREFSVNILRYFNPIGSHKSGLIGDDPSGIPNNLMPYIVQVAARKRPLLQVFGGDYPTADGSCIRDYVHVVDLAYGHLLALKKHVNNPGVHIYNLGTGRGWSVLEVVTTFQRVNDVKVPYKIVNRREGDIAISYANTEKARQELGWVTKLTLEDMCRDSWLWYKNHRP